MAKTKSSNFFGDLGDLPKAVSVEELTAPNFKRPAVGEEVEYEELEDGEGLMDDMFREVEEFLTEEEEELNQQEQEAGGNTLSVSEEKEGDAMKAKVAVLAVEGIRRNLYYYLFYLFVNKKDVKALKRVSRQLSLKTDRTPHENEILQKMWAYLDKHESLRNAYLEDIKLEEEQRNILAKMLELEIRRKRLQGKGNMAKWLVIGSILSNEANAIFGLFSNAIEKPDIEAIDWGALRKAGIDI
jgi:hypothetical protein